MMSATSPSDLTGYEPGLTFGGCEWSPEGQDACPACSGAQCRLCFGIDGDCRHDSLARHYSMPAGYREPHPLPVSPS